MRRATEIPVATGATGMLATFNAAGVLDLADVHTARTVSRVTGDSDETVALALALTVRALRHGSVCVDLTSVADDVFEAAEEGVEVADLPWPEPADWLARCRASRALADGPEAPDGRPLRLVAGNLYLERYWRQEESVRRQLVDRRAAPPPSVDDARLTQALDRLFTGEGLAPDEEDLQRRAAEVCARQWVTVLAGGPGTGKTTTVAKVLAMLADQPGHRSRIALAAPTGKAAARLSEALTAGAWPPRPGRRRSGRRPQRGHPAPPARLAAPQSRPVPAQRRQPAAVRRRRGRRDVDGVADPDGAAAGGGSAGCPARAGGRSRPAVIGGGRGGARRHHQRPRRDR